MKNKKWLCLCLAGLMLLASGCGKQNNVSTDNVELSPEVIGDYGSLKLPLDDKNTEINILATTDNYDLNDSVIVKELEKRTGLDIKVTSIPQESIEKKIRILIAARDQMPDIFGNGFPIIELNQFGMQGAFEPINDHLDELPNFKEIFFDNTEKYRTANTLDYFYADNGDIYSFPTFDTSRYVNHGMLYRKDIFDKHGIKIWNNKEEFIEVLRELKKLYPDVYPFSCKTKSGMIATFGLNWGINAFTIYFDEASHEWKFSPKEKEFRELMDFMKTLYNEGLINPEFLTKTESAWTSEMIYGKAFVTWDWIGRLDKLTEDGKATDPNFDLRYAQPIGGKVETLKQVKPGMVVKKGDKSLLCLKLLDYLISPSGAELMTMGVKDVTYRFDADGNVEYIGFEGQTPGIKELEDKYGLFVAGLYARMDRRSVYFKYTYREQEAQDIMLAKEDGFLPSDPEVILDNDVLSEISSKQVDLQKIAEEFAIQYLLNDDSGENEWKEFYDKIQKKGVDQVLKAYNDAQKVYDSRKK